MKSRFTILGSLGASLLASLCCIGPLVFGAIGVGSIGLASALGPFRPGLIGLTAVFLLAGFFYAYRPRSPAHCEDGVCRPADRRAQRALLWLTTVIALALVTYPAWRGAIDESRAAARVGGGTVGSVVCLHVSGMTCADCESAIERELLQVPGVVGARVDYESERAEIKLASHRVDPGALLAAVKRAGYWARPADARAVGDSAGAGDSPLAAQWRGQLAVGDGQTSDLIVDLGLVGGRWVGQFDLRESGVEDYPVEVALEGRRVTLHLSAAQIDFEGRLSVAGDSLAGIASTGGHRDSLVLRRVGTAHFSDEFLALEKMAEDSTRVEFLATDAAELRKRFNEDRAYARLVMLLSPT